MQYCFSGKTSDDVWRKAIAELYSGSPNSQDSRFGSVLELPHASFTISDPRQRWVYSRSPSINPAFAIAEVFAILGGSNDAEFLNFWNPALPKYAGNDSEYYGAYGHRLRISFGFDQIDKAFNALSNNPASRQVLLQIWDPATDFPHFDGAPRAADIPCNICSLLKVRNGKLDWLQTMRSNDVYRGTPYNFVQFTTLQEIIAGWLNLDVGNYCHVSDSLHLYKNDIPEINPPSDQPLSALINCDDLRLDKKSWDEVFIEAFENMKQLSKNYLSIDDFLRIVNVKNMPVAYSNLVNIAAADSARRRGWLDEMSEAAAGCKNRLLVTLWDNWRERIMA